MITKSNIKEIIKEEIQSSLLAEKVTGKYKVSPNVQMHWGMDKVVIISGRQRVVLTRKELKDLLTGAKRNRLVASYQPKGKQIKEDFGSSARQLPAFSSKEAQAVMDKSIRQYAKILRKAQYNIIKDWMAMAKRGIIDYFDIVRGLQTGDASRAYPFELRFLKGILDKDKIMNRFRQYFGGKKGKKRQ